MKKNDYETVHDEELNIAKYLGFITLVIAVYKTVKGLFMGDTFTEGFLKSWLSGKGVGLFIITLIVTIIFFIKWAIYACMKKMIVNNGTQHDGIIVSEIEKRKAIKGVIHLSWKYVVRLDNGSEVISTRYTQQIIKKKCAVYVWGSWCILTDFKS